MLENLKPAQRVDAPKDWRPAVEFDGTEGHAITPGIPGDQVPSFEEFLEAQGFDSELYEIYGAPRTSRWQRYDGDWLTAYRFSFRLRTRDQIDLPLAWKIAKGRKAKPQVKVESDRALVVMLADYQIGKVDSRGGTEELLERAFDSFARIKAMAKRGKYEKIVLVDVGDIVEGFTSKMDVAQVYGNDKSIMSQVDLGVALNWELIKALRDYAPIVYASVASNHCQFRISKQQVGQPGLDDWGVMIAKQLARLGAETETDLTVLVPDPNDESLAYDVFGDSMHVLGVWHGHQSSRPEGVIDYWTKQSFGAQPISAATIGLTGHFHHTIVREAGICHTGGPRWWIQGRSLDSGSSWYRLNSGTDSPAGITCLELTRGVHYQGTIINL